MYISCMIGRLWVVLNMLRMEESLHTAFLLFAVSFSYSIFLVYRLYIKILEQENKFLYSEQKQKEEHHDTLTQQMEITRKFRHDIASHLRSVENLLHNSPNNQAAYTYANELKREYNKLHRIDYCNDMNLDAVISSNVCQCEAKCIQAFIDARCLSCMSIPPYDMVGVLNHLFHITIKYCQRAEEEKRYLSLTCKTGANYLVLDMCCGLPLSKLRCDSKADLILIKDISHKYNGDVRTSWTETEFNIIVSLCTES